MARKSARHGEIFRVAGHGPDHHPGTESTVITSDCGGPLAGPDLVTLQLPWCGPSKVSRLIHSMGDGTEIIRQG